MIITLVGDDFFPCKDEGDKAIIMSTLREIFMYFG